MFKQEEIQNEVPDRPYQHIRHFGGLNSLRFLAAYLVVLFHGENIRVFRGIPGFAQYSIFKNGPLAVSFFFVLSGFLITYLLLREHNEVGRISVRAFYLRRVLRIWPLYYLLVALGLYVIPSLLPLVGLTNPMQYHPSDVIWWYVFMMPFVVNAFYDVFVIGPLWSIGVEELYYLFIAPVMRFAMSRIGLIFIGVVVAKIILLALCQWGWINETVGAYIRLLAFEQMAIGGLCARWLYYTTQNLGSHWTSRRVLRTTVYTLLFVKILAHQSASAYFLPYRVLMDTPVVSEILLDLMFAWVLLDVSLTNRWAAVLRSRVLDWLGDISYGVYMYHNIVAFILSFGLRSLWLRMDVATATLSYHIILLSGTILVAAASKRWYENQFLRLKAKFS